MTYSEIDKLIAEHVFGWSSFKQIENSYIGMAPKEEYKDDFCVYVDVPKYCEKLLEVFKGYKI